MVDSDFSLDRRVVVITGASSGIGKGVARRFARAGAAVVLAARRKQLLDDLVQELAGSRAIAIETDVAKEEDVKRLAETVISVFGRIDVWVNNAGVAALGRFDQVPLADHIKVLETDLVGVLVGSYFALRQFRRQHQGTLINVASALGKIPAPYYGSYTAAKYGVVGLGAVLRQELKETNQDDIHVCTVMPMAMDTPFFEHAANYTGHEAVPIPPLYDPEQVIETIFGLPDAPQDEVVVGTMGKVMVAAHNVAPGLVEKMMGKETHKEQMEKAPLAGPTRGSVYEPTLEGTEVHGGRLKAAEQKT